MKKLPQQGLQYWALIISATTMGETAGDLVSQSLHLGYGLGTVALLALFVAAFALQIRSRSQHAALYWTVITLASTAGTTISDFLTRSLHLGYAAGTALTVAMLAVVLGVWSATARSTDLDAALSRRTEALYWAAILASSTLGTALGDLISNGTRLGFAGATAALLSLLAAVTAVAVFTRAPRTACYWAAIVVTHPLGATMGDLLTKPVGLDLGNVGASALLVLVFAAIAGNAVRTAHSRAALARSA